MSDSFGNFQITYDDEIGIDLLE